MFSIRHLLNKLVAHPTLMVRINNETIEHQPGEMVLDTLLRAGHSIPYGCRAGACQSCLMICQEGEIPAEAQEGLTTQQKEQGYFLSCSCLPTSSMTVALTPKKQELVMATVIGKDQLTAQVVRLRLKAPLTYRAGQFIQIYRNGAVSRSYSLASVPSLDDYLELHVKKVNEGKFSPWAYNTLAVGDQLPIEGPLGQCFYSPGNPFQPLLLVGLSTGLAPLYGIVRDALIHHQHKGLIHLVVGSRHSEQLYLLNELHELAKQFPNLNLVFVAQTSVHPSVEQGDIYQYCLALVPNCKDHKIFICGADSFVKKMKKQCFLAGAALTDIASDSFLPSGL